MTRDNPATVPPRPEPKWYCPGCESTSASVGLCESCGSTFGLVRVIDFDVSDIPTIEGAPFMGPNR